MSLEMLLVVADSSKGLPDSAKEFITKTRESKEIRDILKGDRGAQAKAATRIEELYRAEFSHALRGFGLRLFSRLSGLSDLLTVALRMGCEESVNPAPIIAHMSRA